MAIILPKLEWQGYECLCWATYRLYTCRCVDGCLEDNELDVHWNLISSKKNI